MKAATLSLALIFLTLFSQAQTKKVTIYSQIYPTIGGLELSYYDLAKFLPDSLKATILIDYKKQYHLRNADMENVLLLMSTDGWKLSSASYSVQQSATSYILSKDIYLDQAAFQLYQQKIKGSLKSK